MAEVESYSSHVVVTYGFRWRGELLDLMLDKRAQFFSRTDFVRRNEQPQPVSDRRLQKRMNGVFHLLRPGC